MKSLDKYLTHAMNGVIVVSLALPATGLVLMKMLPFDNKSEFQVVVDMPAGDGTAKTAKALDEVHAEAVRSNRTSIVHREVTELDRLSR